MTTPGIRRRGSSGSDATTSTQAVEEFFASPPLLFLSGLMALAVGIAMAISHSIWEFNWRGLITVFGYLSIAKGIIRIGFPEVPRKVRRLLSGTGMWIWLALTLALGGWLAWIGFTH